jgi:hypothetical protein
MDQQLSERRGGVAGGRITHADLYQAAGFEEPCKDRPPALTGVRPYVHPGSIRLFQNSGGDPTGFPNGTRTIRKMQ